MHNWRDRKKKLIKQEGASNVRDIWGKVVLYLKEHRCVALHVVCGDITDVKVEGENLVVTTEDKTVLALLEDGRREIERALSWQGKELNVIFQEKVTVLSPYEEDEQTLKKAFGNKFKIKE